MEEVQTKIAMGSQTMRFYSASCGGCCGGCWGDGWMPGGEQCNKNTIMYNVLCAIVTFSFPDWGGGTCQCDLKMHMRKMDLIRPSA